MLSENTKMFFLKTDFNYVLRFPFVMCLDFLIHRFIPSFHRLTRLLTRIKTVI